MITQGLPPQMAEQAEREGFEWLPASSVYLGDYVRAQGGGRTEWFVVTLVEPKPKTIWLRLEPTSPDLEGSEMRSRPRYDDLLPVKTEAAAIAESEPSDG